MHRPRLCVVAARAGATLPAKNDPGLRRADCRRVAGSAAPYGKKLAGEHLSLPKGRKAFLPLHVQTLQRRSSLSGRARKRSARWKLQLPPGFFFAREPWAARPQKNGPALRRSQHKFPARRSPRLSAPGSEAEGKDRKGRSWARTTTHKDRTHTAAGKPWSARRGERDRERECMKPTHQDGNEVTPAPWPTIDVMTRADEIEIVATETCPRCPRPRHGRPEKMHRLHVPTIAAWQCSRCLAVYVFPSA